MKFLNFQDDVSSVPVGNFIDYTVLVLYLTSLKEAIEICCYFILVGQPPRLELNFTFTVGNVLELIVMWEGLYLIAADWFYVVGQNNQYGYCCSPINNQSHLLTQVSVPWIILFRLWCLWEFWHKDKAGELYALKALDNDYKISPKKVNT